jgi:hypothetical protein
LRTAAAVDAGMQLDIEFVDGRVGAIAHSKTTAPRPAEPPRPRRRRRWSDPGQGSLF